MTGEPDQPPPQAQAGPEPRSNPRKHMEEAPLPSGPLPGAELPGWGGGGCGEMRGAPQWLCGPRTRAQGGRRQSPASEHHQGGGRVGAPGAPAPTARPLRMPQ